jgi:hypothetical protein
VLGLLPPSSKGTPSGDSCSRSSSGVGSGSRESCVTDGAASRDGSGELPNGDIEVLARAAVAWVDSNGRYANECSTGALVQAAGADTETAD